jgi:hypothetical protein
MAVNESDCEAIAIEIGRRLGFDGDLLQWVLCGDFCLFLSEVFASHLSGLAEVFEVWLVISRVVLDFRLKIEIHRTRQ